MKIKISPAIIAYGVFFAFTGKIYSFVCYLCALVFHEAGHALAAKRRGYAPESVNIGVMGAAMRIDCVGMKPGDEIIIALAGPFVNACLWLSLAGIWWFFPDVYFYTCEFALANAGLCLFNLLPAYPLDGGRAICAATRTFKHGDVVKIFLSVVTAIFLFVAFILSIKSSFGISCAFAVWFVFSGLIESKQAGTYRKIYAAAFRNEKILKALPVKTFVVSENTTIAVIKRKLGSEHYSVFMVAESGIALSERDLSSDIYLAEKVFVRDLVCYKKLKTSGKTSFLVDFVKIL